MADESSQQAWSPTFDLAKSPNDVKSLYILDDENKFSSSSGVTGWKYRGRQLNGVTFDCLTEKHVPTCFAPLQLDPLHALWNVYYPTRDNATRGPARKLSSPLWHAEAILSFPVSILIEKPHEARVIRGQVCDHPGR